MRSITPQSLDSLRPCWIVYLSILNKALVKFQQPLEDALAGFARKRTFVAGIIVRGEGEEVGGVSLEAGYGVAGHFPNHRRRSRSGVIS